MYTVVFDCKSNFWGLGSDLKNVIINNYIYIYIYIYIYNLKICARKNIHLEEYTSKYIYIYIYR